MVFTVWTSKVALQLLYIKRMDIPNYMHVDIRVPDMHTMGVGCFSLAGHSPPPSHCRMNSWKRI